MGRPLDAGGGPFGCVGAKFPRDAGGGPFAKFPCVYLLLLGPNEVGGFCGGLGLNVCLSVGAL